MTVYVSVYTKKFNVKITLHFISSKKEKLTRLSTLKVDLEMKTIFEESLDVWRDHTLYFRLSRLGYQRKIVVYSSHCTGQRLYKFKGTKSVEEW